MELAAAPGSAARRADREQPQCCCRFAQGINRHQLIYSGRCADVQSDSDCWRCWVVKPQCCDFRLSKHARNALWRRPSRGLDPCLRGAMVYIAALTDASCTFSPFGADSRSCACRRCRRHIWLLPPTTLGSDFQASVASACIAAGAHMGTCKCCCLSTHYDTTEQSSNALELPCSRRAWRLELDCPLLSTHPTG